MSIIKICCLTIVLCLLIMGASYAQISEGGQPVSVFRTLSADIQTVQMPEVDVAALLAEDEIEQGKGIPYRFGTPFEVDYNLENSGTWDELNDGGAVWRLRIATHNAFSINLIYREFALPAGAKLFIYNEDRSHVIGAFTSQNNKEHGQFATAPVGGDVCILEYYEPAAVRGQGVIEIQRIVYAYKNVFRAEVIDYGRDFGESGFCNINVNCPEGADWQDDKRAVALITTGGGFRLCSGVMINNVREDLTPYFLTANHCLGGEATWVFIFQYESPTCDNVDGPTWMSVSGSTLLASMSFSDFGLLELSEAPPDSYNVYYSGWSAIDTSADSCVAIHHPSGDIKKISFNYDKLTSTSYLGESAGDGSHWRVDNWEDGTTEPGSSGSPIYDYAHRIVGQLHGGYASCTSITSDWYGKISISWANGSSASSRLKDWLDPDNTGVLFLDGRDAAGIKITHTPLEDTRDSLNDYEVTAVIKSNTTLTADSLLLYYEISSTWYTELLTSTGQADEFGAFIPAQSPGTVINYYLFARDDEGKSDTTETFSFRVMDYGLSVTPQYDERTVAAHDTAWYSLTVTNVGVYDDDYGLAVSGNAWTTSFFDETGSFEISSTGVLAMDESLSFKVMVEVPASMYGDYDSVAVKISSSGDPEVAVLVGLKTTSAGEPFAIPFKDVFPTATIDAGKWIMNVNGESSTLGMNPPSSPYSLNLDGNPIGADTLMSQAINLKNESNVVISYWYQRTGGADSPEAGDNLYVEYLDSLGSWQLLSQQSGDGEDMTEFLEVETIAPGDAYHSNFRLRLRSTGTAGNFDDWFVDDVFVGHPSDYEVRLSPSFVTNSGPSGGNASFLLTVHNKGLYDDTYDLSSSGGTWTISFYDEGGVTPITTTGNVVAGDSVKIVAEVAIPGSAAMNEADTSTVLATSQGDTEVSGNAIVVAIAAGIPANYPWFEPFPEATLDAERWFYSAGADVTTDGVNPPSAPYALHLDGGVDTAVTQLIDLSQKADVILSYSYEAGGNGEAPDAGDFLWVEYLNDFGDWNELSAYEGTGSSHGTFAFASSGLPADAYHPGFQLRFRSNGSGEGYDDWFIDDIRIDFAPSIAVTPGSFSEMLMIGDSTEADLVVSNGGPGGLNYSVRVQPIVKNATFEKLQASGNVEPARRDYPEGFHDYADVKGVDDPREGMPVTKNAGGPDVYGYYWMDSDEPGGPMFGWLDVSVIGTDVVADLEDDNYGGPYSIGFDFSYYGTTYEQLYVGSNGIIGFETTNMGSYSKTSIPTSSTPNNILAWLWDDLNPLDSDNPGVHVYIDAAPERCVIQFVDYPEYSAAAGEVVNAEVILYPSGMITFQYLSIAAGFDIANCAIGIEDAAGADGLEVAYLTSYLHDGLAIQFYEPKRWLTLSQESGNLAAGEADAITCKFLAEGLDVGVYDANITISSNDPDAGDNPWIVPVQLMVSDEPPYVCGDVDNSGGLPNISDLTYLADYMFGGGDAPPIVNAADVDASGELDISDVTYLVDYLFSGGPAPTCL